MPLFVPSDDKAKYLEGQTCARSCKVALLSHHPATKAQHCPSVLVLRSIKPSDSSLFVPRLSSRTVLHDGSGHWRM